MESPKRQTKAYCKDHLYTEFKQNRVTLVGSKTTYLLMSHSIKQIQTTDSARFNNLWTSRVSYISEFNYRK